MLRALVERNDSRGVIQLVERWLEYGTVSQTARVAQARALLDLRLMDRAWVRLREAATADPGDIEVQLLTAELFVERGWPTKAVKVLDRLPMAEAAEADRRRFASLRAAAASAPKAPPVDSKIIERQGGAAEVIALAELYMSLSMRVRAESLLERLLRDGSTSRRVADLLWAIRGDLDNPRLGTEELLDELGQGARDGDWGLLENTDGIGPVEVTAHVDISDVDDPATGTSKRRGFPSLFRRDENTGESTESCADEITMSSIVVADGAHFDGFEVTDSEATPAPGSGDTRIMEVIQRGDNVEFADALGPIHKAGERDDRSSLDFKSYRAAHLPPDDDTYLEDEDKDLIVMTRREGTTPPPHARSERRAVEVMKRSAPTPTPQPPAIVSSPPSEGPKRRDANIDDIHGHTREVGARPKQVLIGVGAVGVLVALCGWAVVGVLHWIAEGQIIQETHQAIVQADFRSLQELEAKLEGQIALEREPLAVRQVELALVQTELWRRYTGDPDRLIAAQDGLAVARSSGAPEDELTLVDATLSLGMGDLSRARMLIDLLPLDESLQRILAAQIAVRVRTELESRALIDRLGPVPSDGSPLELLTRASLYAAVDEVGSARDLRDVLLSEHRDDPFVQIARFQEDWEELDPEIALGQLADVMEMLPGPVAPRQEAALHAERARLQEDRNEFTLAEESWSAALLLDPAHPKYLFYAASKRLENNEVLGALDDLDRCLGSSPGDYACRRGKVQALVALDRLETARQSVEAWRDTRTKPLSAWVTLAEGREDDALAELDGVDGTLAAYLRGLAFYRKGSPKAAALLGQVVDAWGGIADPMTQVLVARARVAQALQARPLMEVEREVEAEITGDPMIAVMLARALEAAGQRASAERWYQQAVDVGPENAVAQHALGLFWFEPQGDFAGARRVWRTYLDLQPNGDRARRARARMGRR